MQSPMCITKKAVLARLGTDSLHTLNKLIARGVIPAPLPGSHFMYWPGVVAALDRASLGKEPEADNSPFPAFLTKGVRP